MRLTATNCETGETLEVDASEVDVSFIEMLAEFDFSDEKVKSIIDNLDVSADIKVLLYKFSKVTIYVGERMVKIGRKIMDFVCAVRKEYPHASFGLVFGAIVGALISSIPIIGFALGGIATPILMTFGLIGGLNEDLKDKDLERRIASVNGKFLPLRSMS